VKVHGIEKSQDLPEEYRKQNDVRDLSRTGRKAPIQEPEALVGQHREVGQRLTELVVNLPRHLNSVQERFFRRAV